MLIFEYHLSYFIAIKNRSFFGNEMLLAGC